MKIAIILAAGDGTRMKSKMPKVMHRICGSSLLSYVLSASDKAGIDNNLIVVGRQKEMIIDSHKGENRRFVEQPIGDLEPYGTGFAAMQAIPFIEDEDKVVILNGDTPLITDHTIKELLSYHENGCYEATVLSTELREPKGYGRLIIDENQGLLEIVEEKDATEDQKKIKLINSGVYAFNGGALKKALSLIENDNAQGEYYLTDVIGILVKQGKKVGVIKISDSSELHGINSREQLAKACRLMKKRINLYHMNNGVTIIHPTNTYIEEGVEIGQDTIIYPGVELEGNTIIGQDCLIRKNSRIVDSTIGNGVSIESSLIEKSYVADNTTIGPYAHLRPNSRLGEGNKIGNFVEVKNSTLGDNTKASHLAYIGDADVGDRVNIGCGVVLVNYDGKNKHRTTIRSDAFIGSNSNLIAPVEIEEFGYIAAGSTITEKVCEGDLSIARARQVNKQGWVIKKGLLKKDNQGVK